VVHNVLVALGLYHSECRLLHNVSDMESPDFINRIRQTGERLDLGLAIGRRWPRRLVRLQRVASALVVFCWVCAHACGREDYV